jgi:hypothetical protein
VRVVATSCEGKSNKVWVKETREGRRRDTESEAERWPKGFQRDKRESVSEQRRERGKMIERRKEGKRVRQTVK